MENIDLDVLDVRADFGVISDVAQVSASGQERRNDRNNSIESDVANLKDTSPSYLARAVDMFPEREKVGSKKMLSDLKEIAQLNVSGECLMELNARHGELDNRIAIGGKIANAKLTKERNGR